MTLAIERVRGPLLRERAELLLAKDHLELGRLELLCARGLVDRLSIPGLQQPVRDHLVERHADGHSA